MYRYRKKKSNCILQLYEVIRKYFILYFFNNQRLEDRNPNNKGQLRDKWRLMAGSLDVLDTK